jgi:hypothetical protein
VPPATDALSRSIDSEVAGFALVVDANDDSATGVDMHHGFIPFSDQPRTMFSAAGNCALYSSLNAPSDTQFQIPPFFVRRASRACVRDGHGPLGLTAAELAPAARSLLNARACDPANAPTPIGQLACAIKTYRRAPVRLCQRDGVTRQAPSTATTVRLDASLNRPGTVVFTPGSLSRTTCVPVAASPNTLFPIGKEPEVSPDTPMSTASAGSRGIAAAKETCSGTN